MAVVTMIRPDSPARVKASGCSSSITIRPSRPVRDHGQRVGARGGMRQSGPRFQAAAQCGNGQRRADAGEGQREACITEIGFIQQVVQAAGSRSST